MPKKKVTLEQKKKAVQIALDGGSPVVFLKDCGSAAPEQLWYKIRASLKFTDPEKYEMLLAIQAEKKAETAEGTMEEKIVGVPAETVKKERNDKKFRVTGLMGEYGEYHYDPQGIISVKGAGIDLCMLTKDLNEFAKELAQAMIDLQKGTKGE